jgi:2-hydroxychromene-2-carboxylate isomerase
VVVLGQLPRSEHNAMLHLFSASQEQVRYGAEHYRQHSDETSTLLNRLVEKYRKEGLQMPYTMADFRRDYVREHLKDLTPEEIRTAVPPEEYLQGLSPEQIRTALSPEQIRTALSPEQRLEGLSPEQILAALSSEQILAKLPPEVKEAVRKRLQSNEPSAPSE